MPRGPKNYFLHPNKKPFESKTTLLFFTKFQVPKYLFESIQIENILNAPFSSPPHARVHIDTGQVIDIVVVVIIVVVVVVVHYADHVKDSIEGDCCKCQETKW